MKIPLDDLRRLFRRYAAVDFAAASAFLYAAICDDLAQDDELLLADEVLPGQPPPNLLFAAIHALLLRGAGHPLRNYYPDLTASPLPKEEAFPHFRDFALAHADEIRNLVRTRRVQTNVLERCGLLLPAFAVAARELNTNKLAMIEIGASAGLNLLWHRYAYDYGDDHTWGDQSSPVHLQIELRGDNPLPILPPDLTPVFTVGIDLEPVDLTNDDDVLWQRALIWPDRPDRQQRLTAAMTIASEAPPRIVDGDACDLLPSLIGEAPATAGPTDVGLVVFASFSLYQFPREAKDRLNDLLRTTGRTRPLAFLRLDGTPGQLSDASIDMTVFNGAGGPQPTRLLRGHPHGLWIEWLLTAEPS